MIATLHSLEKVQLYDGEFPLVYNAKGKNININDVIHWLNDEKNELMALLSKHGAILFRGFPIKGYEHFDAFIKTFGLKNFLYEESFSNAVRYKRTKRVFTANEAPPSVSIFLHHELAQTPVYPSHLFFYCENAPLSNGETPLCRSDILLSKLQGVIPEFVQSCEKLGVCYTNVMPNHEDKKSGQGRSWYSTLGVSNKSNAERKLNTLGYQWEWMHDGSLKVKTAVLPAVKTLDDKRKVFFNQLIAAYCGWKDERNESRNNIFFGDGSTIPIKDMKIVIELADQLTFDLEWETGDIALIDNYLVMHGRRPYKGDRRVLASLASVDTKRNNNMYIS